MARRVKPNHASFYSVGAKDNSCGLWRVGGSQLQSSELIYEVNRCDFFIAFALDHVGGLFMFMQVMWLEGGEATGRFICRVKQSTAT